MSDGVFDLLECHTKLTFNCSNKSLNDFFYNTAYFKHIKSLSKTTVLLKNDQLIGFFSLGLINILVDQDTSPCIYLEAIAVQADLEKQSLGTSLVQYIISIAREVAGKVAVCGIYLDAEETVVSWYKRFGFIELDDIVSDNPATRPMFLDIRDTRLLDEYFEG